ncbi:MAG: extracellular solute-binding protein [Chloroflexi bacterium]|nr:extracellular solute-binding protein [Chloroflexota bacterium]
MSHNARIPGTASRVMSLFVFIALLAACAGQATVAPTSAPAPTQPPETAAPVVEPTQAPEPTTAEEVATSAPESKIKKYKGKIVIALPAGPIDENAGFKALKEAYAKVQPDVELVWEGPSAGSDYTPWLSTQLAAGDPKVDIVPGNYVPTYGKYLNLDKYRFETNQYTGRTWDEDLDWNFFVYKNDKGERVMLPTEAVHIVWFYNKDIFDKVGVQPPKTWDELVQASEKISAAGYVPIAVNIGKILHWMLEVYTDQYVRDWIEYARAQEGDYNFDPELDGKFKFDATDRFIETKFTLSPVRRLGAIRDGKIRYDSPEITEVMTNFSKVFPKYAQKDFFTLDSPDYPVFLKGEAAILLDGTWSMPSLTRDMENMTKWTAEEQEQKGISATVKLQPFNWNTFENPAMTGPLVKYDVRSVESATGIYTSIVDKNPEQTELALDFLMFWTSKPGYQAWVDGWLQSPQGYSPGGPVMVHDVVLPDAMQAQMDSIKMMGNAENGINLTLLQFSGVGDLKDKQRNLFNDTLQGKITQEEFGKQLQKLYMDNFNDILAKSGLANDDLDNPQRQPGK